ncbi:ABC transporter permease [Stappia indica]|uniref:Phospholipid/cholesterol/gamma-HCH transport system permease protein n=1 Tax=Stappia indica TaxID=538381 RepID=A0A285R5R1_9HYPH|nr:ABC transporter permease [Stappia indica]SOB89214.1 phospholipid/cholesterol/gamma-HCH transport system permease protein [Stappia indica]
MTVEAAQEIPRISAQEKDGDLLLVLAGPWTIQHSEILEQAVESLGAPSARRIHVDLSQVGRMDTAGAWMVHRMRGDLEFHGARVSLHGVRSSFDALISEVEQHHPPPWKPQRSRFSLFGLFERTGRQVVGIGQDVLAVLHIVGSLVGVLSSVFVRPRCLRLVSIATQFDRACIGAVPIVMLMSFLIGAIIAQQGGFYLRQFGADVYVVDLSGVLVLREIGVILTAIMVAGRSGSAFTAEIGSMKMREEIDALHVIGLRVTEVLILPRLFALILALPILTFLSNLAALFGAGLISWLYLDMAPRVFINLMRQSVTVDTLMVGIVKAPFMALIIGLVACVEGMKVSGSAESLGHHTTMSVVKAIFMVIVVDGLFAIFFSSIGI